MGIGNWKVEIKRWKFRGSEFFIAVLLFFVIFGLVSCYIEFCYAEEVRQNEALTEYKKIFEYDHSLPLNVDIKSTEGHKFYEIIRLTYESVNKEKVPAILFVPKNLREHYNSMSPEERKKREEKAIKLYDPPYPVAFYMHYLMGDKEEANMVAGKWAEYGIATFAIDGVNRGEREKKGGDKNILSTDIAVLTTNLRQQIIDISRGIDYLETRDDIDSSRIAFLGVSMGAITGAVACGIDKRIKVIALADGGANLSVILSEGQKMMGNESQKILSEIESKGYTLEKAIEMITPFDPINYTKEFAPRPTILINGRYDEIIPFSAIEELHKAVPEPKKIIIYESGHLLPLNSALYEVYKWMKTHL